LYNTISDDFIDSAIYISAFPIWEIEQRKKGKKFCLGVKAIEWYINL